MTAKTITPQMAEATAKHHERMAVALESVGKTKDAEVAREAARRARASA